MYPEYPKISESVIVAFIAKMQKDGVEDEVIIRQLYDFCSGYRGIALHDNCAMLLDYEEK
jgi:hypothetical protein